MFASSVPMFTFGTTPKCGSGYPPSLPPLPPSQEQASATVLYCAAHPALANISGLYWYECHPVDPSNDALDADLGEGLWTFSERLVAERVGSISNNSEL